MGLRTLLSHSLLLICMRLHCLSLSRSHLALCLRALSLAHSLSPSSSSLPCALSSALYISDGRILSAGRSPAASLLSATDPNIEWPEKQRWPLASYELAVSQHHARWIVGMPSVKQASKRKRSVALYSYSYCVRRANWCLF